MYAQTVWNCTWKDCEEDKIWCIFLKKTLKLGQTIWKSNATDSSEFLQRFIMTFLFLILNLNYYTLKYSRKPLVCDVVSSKVYVIGARVTAQSNRVALL